MKISEVKTAFKIADVEFVAGSTKLNFNYLKDLRDEKGEVLPKNFLKQKVEGFISTWLMALKRKSAVRKLRAV